MTPRETLKTASKVAQRTIRKVVKAKSSPISIIKKAMTIKKTSEKLVKTNNVVNEVRQRTRTAPATPKPKENKPVKFTGPLLTKNIMTPLETLKTASKVAQRTIRKVVKAKSSPISTMKKAMTIKKTSEKPVKTNNVVNEVRQRTRTAPATPKPKENKSVPMPTKSAKKTWNKRPKPAHSGVPLSIKMQKVFERQKDWLLRIANNVVNEVRQRTRTAPSKPKPKENKSVPMPTTVTKSAKKTWNKRPKPAHSGVPLSIKMQKVFKQQMLEDLVIV